MRGESTVEEHNIRSNFGRVISGARRAGGHPTPPTDLRLQYLLLSYYYYVIYSG